eukprot:m.25735 g.25735  ORF g.25735 m.25735 type:complete len:57 (+) comp8759_c0_seq1:176-346(+)
MQVSLHVTLHATLHVSTVARLNRLKNASLTFSHLRICSVALRNEQKELSKRLVPDS